MDSVYCRNNSGCSFYNYDVCSTALLGWSTPAFASWQDFLDSISTAEGLTIGIVSQFIPVVCVTIGSIVLFIFLIKLIRGKE